MASVAFNENDFFYKNANAPIKFDPERCKLSTTELENQIRTALNIPNNITYNNVPQLDSRPGQCTWRKYDSARDGNITKGYSWTMQYSYENGRQTCKCVATDTTKDTTYIPVGNNVFAIKSSNKIPPNLSSLEPAPKNQPMICINSMPTKLQDSSINDISLDTEKKEQLVKQTVDYYKAVCANKTKADDLMQSTSQNLDSDLKYSDVQTFYNREYLNRINLGIGILATCGLIYYTFTASPSTSLVPTIPNIPKP
jgi:hypothetical protein